MLSETTPSTSIVKPRKYFKHFTNYRVFEKVQGVCHLLGYYGDIHLLMDHFLDIFHESSIFKLQATLAINEIMLGTSGETGECSKLLLIVLNFPILLLVDLKSFRDTLCSRKVHGIVFIVALVYKIFM